MSDNSYENVGVLLSKRDEKKNDAELKVASFCCSNIVLGGLGKVQSSAYLMVTVLKKNIPGKGEMP